MTTISIITVTYNSAHTLSAAIESVLGQTYPHIEYIVVDGASKDGTVELVRSYGTRIANHVSEPDNGIYHAMNKGISMATGDYVGFLHADDLLASPLVVEKMVGRIEKSQCDALYGDLEYVSKNNPDNVVRYWKSCDFSPALLKNGWMPPHPTVYIRKEIYKEIGGFNESFRIAADYDFILRLFSRYGNHTAYLDQTIVKMRVGGASNRSIANIIKKSQEDYKAMRNNRIGGIGTLLVKNFSKLGQFVRRERRK
ncbi:MAG: glycosyltransferase family 2 protein [Breznakibacter sp.]